MSVCSKCGKELPGVTSFCNNCGAPVKSSLQKLKEKTGGTKAIKVIIFFIILVLFSVIVFLGVNISAHSRERKNLNLGNKYLNDGNYQEAILSFEKAISIDEKNMNAKLGLAKSYAAIKEYDKAQKNYIDVIKMDSGNKEALDGLYKIYYDWCRTYLDKKDFNKVDELLKEALKLDNGFSKLYTDLSDELVSAHQLKPALDLLKKGAAAIQDVAIKARLEELRNYISGNTSGNIANGGYAAYYNGYVYYNDSDYGMAFFRMKGDGIGREKLANFEVRSIQIVDDWLYFCRHDDDYIPTQEELQGQLVDSNSLYRVKLSEIKEGKFEKLAANVESTFYIIDLNIYYSSRTGGLYRMDMDGSNAKRLLDGGCYIQGYSDDFIYVLQGYRDLYSMDYDGGNLKKLEGVSARDIISFNGWLYYLNYGVGSQGGYEIHRMKEDGSGDEKLSLSNNRVNAMNITGKSVYYGYELPKIYKASLQGTGGEAIGISGYNEVLSLTDICIAGNYMFCYSNTESAGLEIGTVVKIDNDDTTPSNTGGQSGSETDNTGSSSTAPPDFDSWIVSASSTLTNDSVPHNPEYVKDKDMNTAWVEGASGNGIGEWIRLEGTKELPVSGLKIVNGYAKSADLYQKNSRIKKLRIELSDGTTFEKDLSDGVMSYQTVDFGKQVKTSSVRITILEVYNGTKYEDTCISEIALY